MCSCAQSAVHVSSMTSGVEFEHVLVSRCWEIFRRALNSCYCYWPMLCLKMWWIPLQLRCSHSQQPASFACYQQHAMATYAQSSRTLLSRCGVDVCLLSGGAGAWNLWWLANQFPSNGPSMSKPGFGLAWPSWTEWTQHVSTTCEESKALSFVGWWHQFQ